MKKELSVFCEVALNEIWPPRQFLVKVILFVWKLSLVPQSEIIEHAVLRAFEERNNYRTDTFEA